MNYPRNHIESDNRLSWFLGRLDEKYSDGDVFYVHLIRDKFEVAKSYAKRFTPRRIMPAYADGIYIDLPPNLEPWKLQIAEDYVDTVSANIRLFLRDKNNTMTMNLENLQSDFPIFWEKICAEGDLTKAMSELSVEYNHSGSGCDLRPKEAPAVVRAWKKSQRIIQKFPGFIRNA